MKVGKSSKSKEADYAMETVHNLAQVVPEIWVAIESNSGNEMINRSRSEVDLVLMATTVGA